MGVMPRSRTNAHRATTRASRLSIAVMEPPDPSAVARYLAHAHERLCASAATCHLLDALGIASMEMVHDLRLGVIDRTASRALLPRSAGPAETVRAMWRRAGLLHSNGRERLRGCLIMPLDDTRQVVGVRVTQILRPRSRSLFIPPQRATVLEMRSAAPDGSLFCAADPIDALMLRWHGARDILLFVGSPDGEILARARRLIDATARHVLRLLVPGTEAGRHWSHLVTSVAMELNHPFEIVRLPAGCHLRDLRRLHGAEAVVTVARDGRCPRSRVLTAYRISAGFGARLTDPWTELQGSLARALSAHLAHLLTTGIRKEALRRRERELERFRQHCHDRDVHTTENLTADSVAEYQRGLLALETDATRSLSRNAVLRALAATRCFVQWAQRSGRLERDVTHGFSPLRRAASSSPAVLSAAEIGRVLDATRVHTAAGLRDRAMLEIFYSSGIRRVELVGLDVHDIDEDRGVLLVRHGKGGTSRVVPVGMRARQWIARYVETVRIRHLHDVNESALFVTGRGRRIGGKMVTGRMRACLRAAGITKSGSCHVLRHSVATLMHDGGADIRDLQALLGHALLTSTQLYTRVSMQRLLDVHARTHPAERRVSEHLTVPRQGEATSCSAQTNPSDR
jgi:integrase/recombinase XerD